MNEQMITWCIVAAIIAAVFLLSAMFRLIESHPSRNRNRRHIIEVGKEKDMFFIPGDEYGEEDLRGRMR